MEKTNFKKGDVVLIRGDKSDHTELIHGFMGQIAEVIAEHGRCMVEVPMPFGDLVLPWFIKMENMRVVEVVRV